MIAAKPSVAILHHTAPPVVGGVEAVIAEHARLFMDAGYSITIVAGRGGTLSSPESFEVKIIPEIDSEYPENLAVAAALADGEVPKEFFALSDRIERVLRELLARADVVVAHNIMTTHFNLPLTAAMHRLADQGIVRRLIVWCHDVSAHVNPGRGPLRSGVPWDWLRAYRPAATYVAVSSRRQRLLAEVLGCSPERIRVIPNGVDPVLLLGLSDVGRHLVEACGLLEADIVMLMPIRITRAKNIEYGLHVTAALKAAGVCPRLVITGPPDPHAPDIEVYFGELHALRRTLGVDEEVVFIYNGTAMLSQPLRLNPAVVAELYRISDIVLMPSHREGFGMPVLEAGLADKPVFVTAIPIVEELGEFLTQRIMPDEPATEVAGRIMAWAEQDAAHRLRRRVRQEYTWPAIFARHMEPLIAGIVKSGRENVA
ncbi:MAG: glycosyltransferase family 4 protein [Chloroflexi bacterium]|nr:glycosyltransferase family 4 protein [Chloroflexota bacterium]